MTFQPPHRSLLIVEDSYYMRTLIKIALKNQPYTVIGEAGSGKEAIEMIIRLKPDVITLDNMLPDMMGIDILEFIRTHKLNARVVMISQMSLGVLKERLDYLGIDGFVAKPFETMDLLNVLNN